MRLTYLELLEAVKKGKQPKKVKVGSVVYSWDGCEYVQNADSRQTLSDRLPNWTTKGQTTADFLEWLNSEYKKKEEEKQTMDDKAIKIVVDYVWSHLDKTDDHPDTFATFIVWKCKILQNWKWLISTNLPDGMYYEVTYNGDKKEFYLDAYKKFENICIPR